MYTNGGNAPILRHRELLSPEDDTKSSVTQQLCSSNSAAGLLCRRVGEECIVPTVSEIDPATYPTAG